MSETWKFETLSVHAGYSHDPTTKAVFIESLGNPQDNVTDIARIAEIAHIDDLRSDLQQALDAV